MILARRNGETCFITGINGEDKLKNFDLDISFANNNEGTLLFDGDTKIPEIRKIEAGVFILRINLMVGLW